MLNVLVEENGKIEQQGTITKLTDVFDRHDVKESDYLVLTPNHQGFGYNETSTANSSSDLTEILNRAVAVHENGPQAPSTVQIYSNYYKIDGAKCLIDSIDLPKNLSVTIAVKPQ